MSDPTDASPATPLSKVSDSIVGQLTARLQELHTATVRARRQLDTDIEHRMADLAAESSARYALAHMLRAQPVRAARHPGNGALDLIEFALGLVTVDGVFAEFGVHQGTSISVIAARTTNTVYGFDSFEGLPEDWMATFRKGAFDLKGVPPALAAPNIRLIKGWFDATLPAFAAEVAGPAAFLHVDSDLYSSAKTIFDTLGDRIVTGTVIVFDEYMNYPGWEQHEAKAFAEFCRARNVTYRYVAYAPGGNSAAVVIEGVG